MNRDKIEDALLKMGIPSNLLGFNYITDAVIAVDSQKDIKITAMYHDIANKHQTTGYRVERAIRHAFETARNHGETIEIVEHYIGFTNIHNSASLYQLVLKLRRESHGKGENKNACSKVG